jgi:hypothetical protein
MAGLSPEKFFMLASHLSDSFDCPKEEQKNNKSTWTESVAGLGLQISHKNPSAPLSLSLA